MKKKITNIVNRSAASKKKENFSKPKPKKVKAEVKDLYLVWLPGAQPVQEPCCYVLFYQVSIVSSWH